MYARRNCKSECVCHVCCCACMEKRFKWERNAIVICCFWNGIMGVVWISLFLSCEMELVVVWVVHKEVGWFQCRDESICDGRVVNEVLPPRLCEILFGKRFPSPPLAFGRRVVVRPFCGVWLVKGVRGDAGWNGEVRAILCCV